MEENEMIEEMDVVANELLAVQGDVLNSNEAMKAEILGSIGDLAKEVQDSALDTQQSIDELKALFSGGECCKECAAPAPAPEGGLEKAVAELKARLEKQEKTTLICAIAAVVAAIAAVIGLF